LVTEDSKDKANLNPNMDMEDPRDNLKVRDNGTKEVSKDNLNLKWAMEVLPINLKAKSKLVTEDSKDKVNLNPNMVMGDPKDSHKARDNGTKEASKDSLSLK